MAALVPDSGELWISRAEIATRLGRRADALAALARAEALRLTDGQSRRVMARYLEWKDYRSASARLDALLRRSPADAGLLVERARLSAQTGDRTAAAAALARARAQNPGPETLLQIALAYGEARDFARAFELTETLVASRPRDAGVWLARAEFAAGTGNRAAALEALARADALQAGGENRDDEQGRAVALGYQSLKEYGRAIELFSRLIQRHPGAASFLSDRALCEHLNGADDAALADLRAATRLEPKFLPAYLTEGAVLTALDRLPQAAALYDEALAKSPAQDDDPLRPAIAAARKELLLKTSK